MDTKMRIKLYNNEERLISDRLVDQASEFRLGPKNTHKGPLTMEVNLRSKEDVEAVKTYLDKLSGELPLQTTKPMRVTKGTVHLDDNEPIEDLVKGLFKKAKTQEEFINQAREFGFRFIDTGTIKEMVQDLANSVKLKEKHEKYQWMIRIVKEAKDPRNDKYDHRLIFGVKIVGKKLPRVLVYTFGKFTQAHKLPWAEEQKMNFKKVERVMVFPHFMDYEDRKKWRIEHRKVESNPNYTPTKFYTKHLPYVKLV